MNPGVDLFESSVNSYGGKTLLLTKIYKYAFESSVNSYGGKTTVFLLFAEI